MVRQTLNASRMMGDRDSNDLISGLLKTERVIAFLK